MLFAVLGSGVVMTRSRHLIAFPLTTWTQTGLLKALCDGALANFIPGLSPSFTAIRTLKDLTISADAFSHHQLERKRTAAIAFCEGPSNRRLHRHLVVAIWKWCFLEN